MAKLGFPPNQANELEMDMIEAFTELQNAEYEMEWEARIKVLGKLFGGKK